VRRPRGVRFSAVGQSGVLRQLEITRLHQMRREMRKLAIALLLAAPLLAQPHPFTFDDLASIRRVGAPHVSPDGKWVAYDVSTIDMPANYRHSAIYLVPAAGGPSKKITEGTK